MDLKEQIIDLTNKIIVSNAYKIKLDMYPFVTITLDMKYSIFGIDFYELKNWLNLSKYNDEIRGESYTEFLENLNNFILVPESSFLIRYRAIELLLNYYNSEKSLEFVGFHQENYIINDEVIVKLVESDNKYSYTIALTRDEFLRNVDEHTTTFDCLTNVENKVPDGVKSPNFPIMPYMEKYVSKQGQTIWKFRLFKTLII
jgi:hypothetical protein